MSRTIGRSLVAVACLSFATTATAQDEADDPVEGKPAVAMAVPLPNFDVAQWVLGNKKVEDARKEFESALELDIKRFDGKYGLTPAQRKKLRLAGGHDIRRFFERVEEFQAEYHRVNGDWNKVGDRWMELQRIASRPHVELFGDGSMLAKTMRKNLTAEQVARHEKAEYRKKVEWMAGRLHSRMVLSPDQRRKLVDLVAEETPPLGRYGDFDYDAIMFQMSRLPRARLRVFLDEKQCDALTIRFEQARRMEGVLVSEGYLARGKARGSAIEGPLSHREEVRR